MASFHDTDTKSKLRNRRKLSAFLTSLITQRQPALKSNALTYIFCSDEALLQLNQHYLQHDTLTDIITFDLSEEDHRLVGEIHISTERVVENAMQFKVSYEQELHRVIFHGVLHLCGLGDKTDKEAAAMRKAEDEALKGYFDQQ